MKNNWWLTLIREYEILNSINKHKVSEGSAEVASVLQQ